MAKFYVQTTVTYGGVVEADSEAEAEELGWDWGELAFEGVDSISVDEQYDYEEDDDEV